MEGVEAAVRPTRLAAVLSGLARPLVVSAVIALQFLVDFHLDRFSSNTISWIFIAAVSLGSFLLTLLLQPSTSLWFCAPSGCSRIVHAHQYWIWTGLVAFYLIFSHIVAVIEVLFYPEILDGLLSVISVQLWTRSVCVVSAAITVGGLRPLKAL